MRLFVIIIVVAAGVGLEYFLGKLNHWFFGGMIPLSFLAYAVWYSICHRADMNGETVAEFILIFAGLVAMWFEAKENCRKKKKQELEKMKAQDLKRK